MCQVANKEWAAPGAGPSCVCWSKLHREQICLLLSTSCEPTLGCACSEFGRMPTAAWLCQPEFVVILKTLEGAGKKNHRLKLKMFYDVRIIIMAGNTKAYNCWRAIESLIFLHELLFFFFSKAVTSPFYLSLNVHIRRFTYLFKECVYAGGCMYILSQLHWY